jgi:catechol 2,3-dioxygenase-like lactoylglutathione lyase family enzyme
VKIIGLDHVSVTTGDIERSLAFYRDVLGLPVRSVGEVTGAEVERLTGVLGARLLTADLDLGRGQILELVEYVGARDTRERSADDSGAPSIDTPGGGHVGLLVDDVDETHRRLVEAGAIVRSEPVELTEPGDWFGARCVTVLDPDGVAVELVERPGLAEPLPARSERRGIDRPGDA